MKRWPAWRVGALAGAIVFIGIELLFTTWTHWLYAGQYAGSFLISERFGVPERLAAAGIEPVYPTDRPGWDGQFYYFLADDPFLRRDTATHLDNPAYRAQRIGVPVIAWTIARLTGQSTTPPRLYHLVQILMISFGAGVLAGWLYDNGLSPIWVLGWLGAAGPLYAFAHGLPDASGDALFAVVIVAMIAQRLAWYLPAMVLLVLVREGYVVVAFAVFIATIFGFPGWGASRWRAVLWTALPGIVLVAWTVYLSLHFGQVPWSSERSPSGLYDLPFRAVFHALGQAADSGDVTRWRLMAFSAFTVFSVLLGVALRLRQSWVWVCILPQVMLSACLGSIVWEQPEGFLKTAGSALIPALLLLPTDRYGWMRFVLIVNLVMGVEWLLIRSALAPSFETPTMRMMNRSAQPAPTAADVTDHRMRIRWVDASPVLRTTYQGIYRPVHQEAVPLTIEVTNLSEQAWPTNVPWNANGVELGYAILSMDGTKVVDGGYLPLGNRPFEPDETRTITLPVRIGRRGYYFLKVGMVSGRREWFDAHDGSSILQPIRVE